MSIYNTSRITYDLLSDHVYAWCRVCGLTDRIRVRPSMTSPDKFAVAYRVLEDWIEFDMAWDWNEMNTRDENQIPMPPAAGYIMLNKALQELAVHFCAVYPDMIMTHIQTMAVAKLFTEKVLDAPAATTSFGMAVDDWFKDIDKEFSANG